MTCVEFTVNGQKCTVNNLLHRETSLSAYIRYFLGLPGTKAMCRQGVCGACIVNVTARRHISGEIETFSVNSCLVLVFSCHGWDITTVEAIGNRGQGYSEFQKRIAAFHGTQCGFCTPGWVMQMQRSISKDYELVDRLKRRSQFYVLNFSLYFITYSAVKENIVYPPLITIE